MELRLISVDSDYPILAGQIIPFDSTDVTTIDFTAQPQAAQTMLQSTNTTAAATPIATRTMIIVYSTLPIEND